MAPPPAPLLRHLLPDDLPAAMDLWSRCEGLGRGTDDVASWRRFLERNPGLSFAAELEGRLVGTVLGGSDGRRGVVYRLAVDPRSRRAGLARQLVEATFEALRAEGIARVLVFLFEENEVGSRFWSALGAEPHPEVRFHTFDL